MVKQLIGGKWKGGQKIPTERDLCSQLGVGRASLREALKGLEIMGLIEIRLGDGTYVCDRSEFFARPLLWSIVSASGSNADARELVESRTLIEVEMAGLAAARATAKDIETLTLHLKTMEAVKGDAKQFVQADVNFHLAIAVAASNKILMNALNLIRNLLQDWVTGALSTRGVAEKACKQHRLLLQAIQNHDVASARTAMQEHLHAMAVFLLSPKDHVEEKRSR
jgi:GntR family transcriptional repressor for pyruvate dehydrogenase complex